MSLLDTASLIVTPNAVKEGKLYSVIPSDGSGDLSVTRATTATRVNSAGLVELVPYNLLGYSEAFDNSYWTKYLTTITADATTAPNGTTTADLFTSTGNGGYTYSSFTAVSSGVYTLSIYAKKGNTNFVALTFSDGIATDCTSWYNINTNTLGSTSGSITITNRTIEDAGNGWSRLTLTISLASAGSFIFLPQFVLSDTAGTATGNTGYAWGAQLVEGSTAKDYQKTETRLNIPRLDYSNGTCPSLLVEPQRTNLITYSSSFDNSSWVKIATSVTANSIVSPSGLQDADTLTANGSNALHIVSWQSINFGANNTISVYAKKGTNNFLQIYTDFVNTDWANFDLNNGVIGSYGSTTSNVTIEDAGNGWYRCSMVTGSASSQYVNFSIITSATSPRTETNSLSTSVYLWGAQLEAGSYATSYIPTTSASVTRNADELIKTSATALIGQTEGTILLDVYRKANSEFIVFFSKGTTTPQYVDVIYFYQTTNGNFIIECYKNNVLQFNLPLIGGLNVGNNKIALAYSQTDIALYVNGFLTATDNYADLPEMNNICINTLDIINTANFGINALALWKTRLTNTQLAQLTSI